MKLDPLAAGVVRIQQKMKAKRRARGKGKKTKQVGYMRLRR